MDDKPKTVRARVLRDFNDAGTERRFTAKSEVDLTEGEFANYRVGGLVELIEAEASAAPVGPDAPAASADSDAEAKKGARKS